MPRTRSGAAPGGGICETDAMAMKKRITLGLVVLAALAALVWALSPRPIAVAMTEVRTGPFAETVREEGRTRLRDRYTVSAPIGGYLHRVRLEEGDPVEAGDTLFRMQPLPTPALDLRSHEQARESLEAARARLTSAEAGHEEARAEAELAESDYRRVQRLFDDGAVPRSELDAARSRHERAQAGVRAAASAVEGARAEAEIARLLLEIAAGRLPDAHEQELAVRAPATGVVLARHRYTEGTVQPGEPVIDVGSLDDLEVRVDLLSVEAVRVHPGMPVRLLDWGGDEVLEAEVRRVDPDGFTRVSALGVDEQRVPVILDLDPAVAREAGLAVGYHVEAEFLLWEGEDVLQIPTSALFRHDGQWSVFVVEDGRARLRAVEPGRRADFVTQIVDGLEAGEVVVTRPGDRLDDGVRVRPD